MVQHQDHFSVVAKRFFNWLHQHTLKTSRLVIVAHNGKRFDFRMLASEFARIGTSWNQQLALPALCFFDTLLYFQAMRKHGLIQCPKLTLSLLHERITGQSCEGMHDALNDVRALERIVLHPNALMAWDQKFLSWEEVNSSCKQPFMCAKLLPLKACKRKRSDNVQEFIVDVNPPKFVRKAAEFMKRQEPLPPKFVRKAAEFMKRQEPLPPKFVRKAAEFMKRQEPLPVRKTVFPGCQLIFHEVETSTA